MIPKFHLITINQIMIKILKTTKSLIFPVPCNVRLTVRSPAPAPALAPAPRPSVSRWVVCPKPRKGMYLMARGS